MTQIFADGFESGDFSAWTGIYGTPTVQGTIKHHGTYAMLSALTAANTGKGAYKDFASTYATLYFKGMVYVSATPASGKYLQLIGIADVGDSNDLAMLAIYNNSGTLQWKLYYKTDAGSGNATSNTPTISVNTWYFVELRFHGATSTGDVKAWIVADGGSIAEGSPTISVTGLTNDNVLAQEVYASTWIDANLNVNVYEDCCVVSDAYIGPEASSVLQTVTDSLSLNDALLRHKIFAVSESIGAVDVIAGRNKSPLLTFDSISLVDLACTGKQLIITDAMRINDFSSLPSRILKALDSIGISDDFTVQKTIIVNDNVSLVELAEAGVGGSKKTRLLLILGDLAIQLSGD